MIRRLSFLFLLAVIASGSARAQNVNVTATIVDPSGIPYSFARVSIHLQPPGVSSPLCGGPNGGGVSDQAVTTNAAGSFSISLCPNSSIVPSSPATQWGFTVSEAGVPAPLGTGPQTFTVALTISGAGDISSSLNAAAPALSNFSGSGTVISGTQCYSAVYKATANQVGPSSMICDLSAFSGAHWTDKLVTAFTALGGTPATIYIAGPTFNGDDGSGTNPTVPSNVKLKFTGAGTLTFCQINLGAFSKLDSDDVLLQMKSGGSGCTGISLNAQATLQSNDTAIINGIRIDCNSQSGSTGWNLGLASTAHLATNYNSVSGCSVGGIWTNAQFTLSTYDHFWNNGVNVKIYNSSGSGNSNFFDHLIANNPTGGCVNVIVANTQGSPINGQGDNVFIAPEFQNGPVAEMAVFGASTAGSDVHIYGGAWEVGGSGGSSCTVDGMTINKAMLYASQNAYVYVQDMSVAEATISPVFSVNNSSVMSCTHCQGYGNTSGTIAFADSTSKFAFEGYQGWVSGATLTSGAGTFIGTPPSNQAFASANVSGPLALAIGSTSAPPYSFAGHTSTGLFSGSSGVPCLSTNNLASMCWFGSTGYITMLSGQEFGWLASATTQGGSPDTGFYRISSQHVGCGNGSTSDTSCTLALSRLVTGTQAPTCTFTSGGGTSPSCTLDTASDDSGGIIIATTGTGSPAGTGTITLIFSTVEGSFGTHNASCVFEPSSAGAGQWAALAAFADTTPSSISDVQKFTNGTTPTALSASTAYWINYHCRGKS